MRRYLTVDQSRIKITMPHKKTRRQSRRADKLAFSTSASDAVTSSCRLIDRNLQLPLKLQKKYETTLNI
jgi:hypothetical protein